jgi:hypothetical protein
MVYTACATWFQDWIDADPPTIEDEWDASEWLTHEMTAATRVFLHNAFHSMRARNDAVMILRTLYYEYALFRMALARNSVPPVLDAPSRLQNAPQTPQKSATWHLESREMLSGHEFGGILTGGPAEYNTVIAKKCVPPANPEDYAAPDQQIVFLTPSEGLSPFKWGWRYEPVARDLFEMEFSGGVVYDGLGRMRHPTLPRLGASPDGVITAGPKIGRLVELKCPISRELNGSIPINYWIQMQLQAEVCDVPAVEYFEVALGSMLQTDPQSDLFESKARASKLRWVGKVCVVAEEEDSPSNTYRYVYSPLFSTSDVGLVECQAWSPPTKDGVVLESTLWWVKDYFTTTVMRNPRWWESVGHPAYVAFWEDVSKARTDGRHTRVAVPMFVEDEWAGEATGAEEGTGQTAHDAEGDADATANDDSDDDVSSAVEGWQGAESDHDSAMDTCKQSDIDSDLECEIQIVPANTQ